MADWRGSTRKRRLPPNWRTIVKRIHKRDGYRCTWIEDGQRCTAPSTDVDHRIPNDDHSDENLQALCNTHHLSKTGSDSHWQRRKAINEAKKRNDRRFGHQEEHTGTGKPFAHPWMR